MCGGVCLSWCKADCGGVDFEVCITIFDAKLVACSAFTFMKKLNVAIFSSIVECVSMWQYGC